jgi:hypothetical protein
MTNEGSAGPEKFPKNLKAAISRRKSFSPITKNFKAKTPTPSSQV